MFAFRPPDVPRSAAVQCGATSEQLFAFVPANSGSPATATASAEFPTFTSFFTRDTGASTNSITADKPVVLTELDQAPALPNDDETTDDFSDDLLATKEPADERVAIDDKTVDNLFADFEETLLDELLAF